MNLFTTVRFSNTLTLPPLIQDYLLYKESVSHLYKYPFQASAFSNAMADKASDKTDRNVLVEVLKAQYAAIDTSPAVTKNIEALLSEKTFTVTAAHQPCLFMGPLYNIYKIAGAIRLAQQLTQAYPDNNFVPVFWLGSEDHDVEELTHTYINGKRIEWNNAGNGASGRWKTETMQAAVEELKLITNHAEITSVIEEGLKKYKTFGQLSEYLINHIFKEYGLVVLDGDHALLKKNFSAVIQQEILSAKAVEVLKPVVDFLEANYKAQAKPREINFFYLTETGRERIVLNNPTQRFEINNTALSFSADEIKQEIENHPERFSPNVIYRPLYQEFTLPNLAFTGGAGELSYWLELKPLFDYYRVNYPMQVLRHSFHVINPSVQKKLDKLNLTVNDFTGEVKPLINRYVQQSMPANANLTEEKTKLSQLFESVIKKAETSDVTLKQSAATEKQKALTALENLEAKMLKAEKRKQETTVNQIQSIHDYLFPEGVLQERRENFIPYYSNEFIAAIIAASGSW